MATKKPAKMPKRSSSSVNPFEQAVVNLIREVGELQEWKKEVERRLDNREPPQRSSSWRDENEDAMIGR